MPSSRRAMAASVPALSGVTWRSAPAAEAPGQEGEGSPPAQQPAGSAAPRTPAGPLALTFNDGPDAAVTPRLLDLLARFPVAVLEREADD